MSKIDYQKEFLSIILNDVNTYTKVFASVKAEMFTGDNKLVFEAFSGLILENKKPDLINLRKKTLLEISTLTSIFTHYNNASININSLLEGLYNEMLAREINNISDFVKSQLKAGAECELIKAEMLKRLNNLEYSQNTTALNMQECYTSLVKQIEANRKSKELTGVPTGLKIFDKHMGGLQKDYIIIAGETSHLKTALALTMLYNSAVLYAYPCGIISHEMTTNQLMSRLTAYATNISSKRLLTSKIDDDEFKQINAKIEKLLTANLFIQDFINTSLQDTVAAIRLMVLQHKIKYVVVENAGNITVKGAGNDEVRTATISKTLKSLQKELNISIILITHLSRDGQKKQPELHRLKHSGQLENDADVVIFTYRAELHGYNSFKDANDEDLDIETENRAKVYCAKGRNYGLAQTYCNFNPDTLYMTDYVKYGDELIPNTNFTTPF